MGIPAHMIVIGMLTCSFEISVQCVALASEKVLLPYPGNHFLNLCPCWNTCCDADVFPQSLSSKCYKCTIHCLHEAVQCLDSSTRTCAGNARNGNASSAFGQFWKISRCQPHLGSYLSCWTPIWFLLKFQRFQNVENGLLWGVIGVFYMWIYMWIM